MVFTQYGQYDFEKTITLFSLIAFSVKALIDVDMAEMRILLLLLIRTITFLEICEETQLNITKIMEPLLLGTLSARGQVSEC